MAPQRAEPQQHSVKFLHSASNVAITGGSFIGVQQNYTDPLERLYARVSSNAILNAGGRADHVRCHPGTREEVIGIIEKWIDGGGDLSRCIFWLSGPAGAGKSAIMQTIAERCIQRKAPMANYFFFRADPTRNDHGSIVATLLYQILQFYPALKEKIITLLNENPLVFYQSIRDQFNHLLDVPVRSVVDDSVHTKRLVLLIDGLDECSQEAKHIQRDLLHSLQYLISQQGSPFVVLVASRAEPHLVMAFNEIGSSMDSIFLDANYRPSDDIRRFVTAEFDKIKKTHHLRQTLRVNWPPKVSIDEIVNKSSGQFVYAVTVMRFLSNSSASPAYSLDKVRGMRPIVKNSPFAELDAIYAYILAQAEDWELVKDVLASQLILFAPRGGLNTTLRELLAPLGRTEFDIESCLSDLGTVMQYKREYDCVTFYHASLQDFLCDESRSKASYIDLQLFTVKCAVAHISAMSSIDEVELFSTIFTQVKITTPLLRDALVCWKPFQLEPTHSGEEPRWQLIASQCTVTLQKLYYENDNLFYRTMLQKWLTWFSDLELPRPQFIYAQHVPEAKKVWDDIEKNRQSCTGETSTVLPKEAFWRRGLSKIRPFKK